MTDTLPPGWELVALGDVVGVRRGKAIPQTGDGRAYVSLDSIESHTTRIVKWESSSNYGSQSARLFSGDVAYARLRPYLNKVALIDREALGSAELIVIPPSEPVEPKFLVRVLSSEDFVRYASRASTGDRPRLYWSQMRNYPMPLAPLGEQRRIVAAIEGHFSRIDAIESYAQSALAKLAALRQSILSVAFCGQLTSPDPTRPHDTLPLGWKYVSLQDLATEIKGQIRPQADVVYDLYSVPAYQNGEPERLEGSKIKSGKRTIRAGDVLLCKINPRINRVWVVDVGSIHPKISSTEYLVLRPNSPGMSEYLCRYLSSPKFRAWIELSVEGVTGSHTRAKSGPILSQHIPVSPRTEQNQIVSAIEEHFSRLDNLEAALKAVLDKCELLRKSVLTAAFSGQLVVQDADDEPVSLLLQRIAQD